MTWIVLVALALNFVLLVLFWHFLNRPTSILPPTDPRVEIVEVDATDAELARAAIELHRISSRLDTAWDKHRLKGDAHRLRRELADELRQIEVLEGRRL